MSFCGRKFQNQEDFSGFMYLASQLKNRVFAIFLLTKMVFGKKPIGKNTQSVITSIENYDNIVSYVHIPLGP